MNRFIGYDPGGNGAHGVAELILDSAGAVAAARAEDVSTATDALSFIRGTSGDPPVAGLGIDTLTEWCLGPSGWRPADMWLRATYPTVGNSVASPNSLFGAMGINGMGVLVMLRAANAPLTISETHPKVLYFALSKTKYDWRASRTTMVSWLSAQLGTSVSPASDDAFDALLSAWACAQGVLGKWPRDLHQPIANFPPVGPVVRPGGATNYFWP